MKPTDILLRIIEYKQAGDLNGYTRFINNLSFEEAMQLRTFAETLAEAARYVAKNRMEEWANDNEVH